MKNILFCALLLVAVVGCSKHNDSSPLTSTEPTVYNPNGTWSYSGPSLTYDPGTCGLPSNPYPTISGTFTVVQVSTSIVATTGAGVVFSGSWANNAAEMLAIYLAAPSVTETDIVDFGLSSDTAATGLVSWQLSDGVHVCRGSNRLTASKI